MQFSLVTTVLNDCEGVKIFLARMSQQTCLPDEVVVVDGGSKDGTWPLLQEEARKSNHGYKLVVDQEVGCNVARGRDLAIKKSTGQMIVSTDVGCEWDPEWYEELIAPVKKDPTIDVVVGSWAVRGSDAKSDWAKVELARRWPFRMEATPDSLSINRAIVYKREVWEKVGGYPQDLSLAADDVVFDMIIRQPKYGFKFAAAPVIRCYWERHETLKQFCKEERRNFFGAGEAKIWGKHFILVSGRLLVEAGLVLAGILFLFVLPSTWIGVLLIMLALVSVGKRISTLWPAVSRLKEMKVSFPLARLLWFEYQTKIYGMYGYLLGLLNGNKQCLQTRRRLSA